MKSSLPSNVSTAVWPAAQTATSPPGARADQSAKLAEKSYTGAVKSFDLKERSLDLHRFALTKKFSLGATCNFILPDKSAGTLNDLRPGEKVTVSYQDASGVLVVDRIEQHAMTCEGMVRDIDPAKHTMTLHFRTLNKDFQLPDDCKIVLRNEASGRLTDIQPGNHVAVTYEKPHGRPTAREIAQTSIEFTGWLTAFDLEERTLKAQSTFGSKKFNLANNCAIVINGKTDGQPGDLKPNDRLVFTFDEINGVNVVNRIAPAPPLPSPVVITNPGTPY